VLWFTYNTANNPDHAASNRRITDELKGIAKVAAVAQTRYHTAGLHKSSKNLEANSKFYAPEVLHQASSIPRTNKYKI
jgi:hypothetical protein